jgi:hypothetical protein
MPSKDKVEDTMDALKSSIDDIAKAMPDKQKVEDVLDAKKEALEYDKTAVELQLVDGMPSTNISPRDAKMLSHAHAMQKNHDINNEKFDDDDFDFVGEFAMPMIGFKGISSELDVLHGLFDSPIGTNPFDLNFDIFSDYQETRETL